MERIFFSFFIIFIISTSLVKSQFVAVESKVKLPKAKHGSCAVYDGNDSIYILGGYSIDTPQSSEIYKYTISSDNIAQIGELPLPVFEMSASIDTSGNIYTHGGMIEFIRENGTIGHVSLTEIYRFDPVANTTSRVADLPAPNLEMVSIPGDMPNTVYILAGHHEREAIVLFNMTDLTVSRIANLQKAYWFMTAVSSGDGFAFIFGNEDDNIAPTYPVAKVNLNTRQASYGPPTFPRLLGMPAAVWDGKFAYIIGGYGNISAGYNTDTIIQFDPSTLENKVITVANFPTNGNPELFFAWTSAVYVPKLHRIYIFGGINRGLDGCVVADCTTWRDGIWYIDLPQSSRAAMLPSIGYILLSCTILAVMISTKMQVQY
ncbi:uncharacterized protein LOC110863263 [Folsomia candida]|uniref:Kelch domain-containing protein 8B n=1 Tax=Folsomia candida TaxID=158441 RepID=A0A226F1L9_FOLCA|nr:uncharacterized protein LOC110863263 [Folsomia candida]OXA63368.1 Kelch domain-containing protein 8B [Folsomia candida]